MNDYIDSPIQISSISSNNFDLINFEKYILSKNKFHISLSMDLYKNDKELFIKIRDEMILRGFTFNLKYRSNLFPKKENNNESYTIKIEDDKERFRKINFYNLGMHKFIEKYNVTSDLFFLNIDLINLIKLYPSINIKLVVSSFKKSGFKIIRKIKSKKKNLKNKTVCSKFESVYNHKFIIDFEPVYQIDNEYKGVFRIEEILTSVIFENFVKYAIKNFVFYMEEISWNLVADYLNVKLRDVKDIGDPLVHMLKLLPMQYSYLILYEDSNKEKYDINHFLTFKPLERRDFLYKSIKQEKLDIIGENESLLKYQEKILEKSYGFDPNTFYYDKTRFDIGSLTVNEVLNYIKEYSTVSSNYKLRELLTKDIEELDITEKDKITIKKLNFMLNFLDNPVYYLDLALDNINDRDFSIIEFRFNQKLTLEEIGEIVSLTRERIRQIIKNTCKKINRNIRNNKFFTSFLFKSLDLSAHYKGFIKFNEFEEIFGEKYIFILNEFGSIIYVDFDYQLVFLNFEMGIRFEEYLKMIYDNLPNTFKTISDIEVISIYDEFHNCLDIDLIAKLNDYKKFNDIDLYSKLALTIPEIVKKYIKDKNDPYMIISESNYFKIFNEIKSFYNFEISNTWRSLSTRLHDSEDYIFVDTGLYKLFYIEDYDMDLILRCKEYINTKLDKMSQINIEAVFLKYKSYLINEGINNKLHLYSVLRNIYSDEFTFGKGNTLNIYINDESKTDYNKLIVDYIKSSKEGFITVEEICNQFKWSETSTRIKLGNSKNIIWWGFGKYRVILDSIGTREMNLLKRNINSRINAYGFLTEGQLYDDAKNNPILLEFLHEQKVDSQEKFRLLLRNHLPILKGNDLIITNNEYFNKSHLSILINRFPIKFTMEDFDEFFVNELKYKLSTKNFVIAEALENEYIEVDYNIFFRKDLVKIDTRIVKKVIDYIEDNFLLDIYISLTRLYDFKEKLLNLKNDYEWSPHLIKYILINNGYRHLEFSQIKFCDQMVIVRSSSPFETLEDLFAHLIKNHYDDEITQSKLNKFSIELGLVNNNKKYELHSKLYEEEKYIKIDEFGEIQLKNEFEK